MKPTKEGVYWIKARRRFSANDPPEGVLSGWMVAKFQEGWWFELGSEIESESDTVEVIGPEIVPPE